MEENVNEQKTIEFQSWLEKNNWKFNEDSELYINKDKKELKTNDELIEIFDHEKELEEIEAQRKKEVELQFELFLNRNGWRATHNKDEFINRKSGDKKQVMELVEEFKAEINKNKEQKKEQEAKETKEVKEEKKEQPIVSDNKNQTELKPIQQGKDALINTVEVSEEEGERKLREHKGKGHVKRTFDKNSKKIKVVSIRDNDFKVIESFYFKCNW